MTFFRTEAWLTLIGSKTLDSDLGMFIPNQGLDNAATEKLARTNNFKINYEHIKQESNSNKNITNNDKTQQTY